MSLQRANIRIEERRGFFGAVKEVRLWFARGQHAALNRDHDRMAVQDAEFREFETYLPARGTIGYLEPFGGFNDDTTRAHFAAQYSLAPRVIVARPDFEFLIVADGAAQAGGDPRLAAFARVTTLRSGHRLFRRFP